MKTLLASAAILCAATSAQAITFDFMWSSENAVVLESPDEIGLFGLSGIHYMGLGTVEINVGNGEAFSSSDIGATNIILSGPALSALQVSNWLTLEGQISVDGNSASLTDVYVEPSIGSGFGCASSNCASGIVELFQTGSVDDSFNFLTPTAALASFQLTRQAPSPVPLPAAGLLLIGALGALGLARRKA